MTNRLAKAFATASSLPEELQDQLADQFFEEIEWERRWSETLANSKDTIDQLAECAEQNFREGKTIEMGFDEL